MNAKLRFSVLAAALLLAACGNKGPLVMPQKPVPVEQPVPEAPPAQDPAPAAPLPEPPAAGTPAPATND